MKNSLVVFDLDGTLALCEHRRHFVERPVGEKDWDAFFDACGQDEPNMPVIMTLFALEAAGFKPEIWSGRIERVWSETEQWLKVAGLDHLPLKMRPMDDRRPDTVLKKSWLDAAPQKPMMTFDDRDSVVAMWRENGIVCAQVAPGDF
jgi:hypothetical protein